ncbi:hypothetical protein NIE88_01950 [Sporolactobacillus shoreicorticis]|uniref:Immunoglobulin-like domain-containing protein n=1 Tax=Sporolactobacillus shoreicorticis TaxID=1923877 RepID=A0ABW5S457_9BACL|nr:immunoglobulin-like domain-containing protein [Sporolactobacillus shoreicorticis]MCO7124542.1 hypothetical protein [Sporolactobacillus shoreicorticis]
MKQWIVTVVILLFLTGCGAASQKENGQNLKMSPYTQNDFKHVKGIRIYMSQGNYPVKSKDFTLIIENNTEQSVIFGVDYTFEIERNRSWYAPFRKDAAFIEIGQQLNPYKKVKKKYRWIF